jgi:hypothetical protein
MVRAFSINLFMERPLLRDERNVRKCGTKFGGRQFVICGVPYFSCCVARDRVDERGGSWVSWID